MDNLILKELNKSTLNHKYMCIILYRNKIISYGHNTHKKHCIL